MQGNTELKRGVLQKTRMLQCQDARSLVSSSQNLLPTNSSLLFRALRILYNFICKNVLKLGFE